MIERFEFETPTYVSPTLHQLEIVSQHIIKQFGLVFSYGGSFEEVMEVADKIALIYMASTLPPSFAYPLFKFNK